MTQAARIELIRARQLIDCKCRPMVEVDIVTDTGKVGRAAAPTGQSVGIHEAFVLRDEGTLEYGGLSVHRAVGNVLDVIAPALVGMPIDDQKALDDTLIALDGTTDKRNIGGNAIYATSVACLRAAAAVAEMPVYRYLGGDTLRTVPVPSFNMVNGGRYGDITQSFNEFIVMPYRADSIFDAVESCVRLFDALGDVLSRYRGMPAALGRSYGYAAPSSDPEVVLTLMQDAIDSCGLTDKIAFALDCASSEVYSAESDTYLLKSERANAQDMISYLKHLSKIHNIIFIEDLLHQDDWDGHSRAVEQIDRSLIIGDDLIVTNQARLEKAVSLKAVAGFVLKPNQVGTISEALATHRYALEKGLIAVPSGRSGGVIDDIVMDLSVGLQVLFQKNGAPRSGERIEKLNFLMRAADFIQDCELADVSPVVRF